MRIPGRAVVLAALAAVLPLAAAGQERSGSVEGVVVDATGQPLAHARVVVLPVQRETETGRDGRFVVRQLGPGEYRVQVSLLGYAPAERVLGVRAGAASELEVRLAATPLTLGGLQVTASAGARAPNAVTQATTQLTGRALDRELGGSIAQTLRYQPGMAVRSLGPGASMPVIRGLTGDRVLVLQDGQRTADLAGSADDHGVTIDPLSAQRVEVVRGPATLLYGNNALGGVVNVISGDVSGGQPLRPELSVAAQTESAYPGAAVTARGTAPVGDAWSVTARAGVREAGDMRIATDPVLGTRLANTGSSSRNGSLAVARVAPGWTGSAAVRAYDFRYGLPVPVGAEPVTLRGDRAELSGRAELLALSRRVPAARVEFTVQDYGHDELDGDGAVAQRFELRTGSGSVLLRQDRLGPFREGALGVSLLLKDYRATGPAALTPAATSRAAGVFGFQELALGGSGAALQLGARVDRYAIESESSSKFGDGVARTFDAFSGSAGIRVPFGPLAASVTGGRSFRAPTVEELFSGAAHAGTGSVEYGDATLREERGRTLEAVLQVSTARLNGQLSGWINRVDDLVQLQLVGDTVIGGVTLPVHVYAQAPATLRGVEGSLEVALRQQLAVALRGDWLHTRQADGSPLSFMPPARLGVSLRWDDGRLSAGGDVHHDFPQHRTGAAGEEPTAAHTILRLDGGVRFRLAGRLHSVSLRIDNAGDAHYHEATSRTKEFAPAVGRNIALLYRGWF
jgi:iron complex outermembrane recepter protein